MPACLLHAGTGQQGQSLLCLCGWPTRWNGYQFLLRQLVTEIQVQVQALDFGVFCGVSCIAAMLIQYVCFHAFQVKLCPLPRLSLSYVLLFFFSEATSTGLSSISESELITKVFIPKIYVPDFTVLSAESTLPLRGPLAGHRAPDVLRVTNAYVFRRDAPVPADATAWG